MRAARSRRRRTEAVQPSAAALSLSWSDPETTFDRLLKGQVYQQVRTRALPANNSSSADSERADSIRLFESPSALPPAPPPARRRTRGGRLGKENVPARGRQVRVRERRPPLGALPAAFTSTPLPGGERPAPPAAVSPVPLTGGSLLLPTPEASPASTGDFTNQAAPQHGSPASTDGAAQLNTPPSAERGPPQPSCASSAAAAEPAGGSSAGSAVGSAHSVSLVSESSYHSVSEGRSGVGLVSLAMKSGSGGPQVAARVTEGDGQAPVRHAAGTPTPDCSGDSVSGSAQWQLHSSSPSGDARPSPTRKYVEESENSSAAHSSSQGARSAAKANMEDSVIALEQDATRLRQCFAALCLAQAEQPQTTCDFIRAAGQFMAEAETSQEQNVNGRPELSPSSLHISSKEGGHGLSASSGSGTNATEEKADTTKLLRRCFVRLCRIEDSKPQKSDYSDSVSDAGEEPTETAKLLRECFVQLGGSEDVKQECQENELQIRPMNKLSVGNMTSVGSNISLGASSAAGLSVEMRDSGLNTEPEPFRLNLDSDSEQHGVAFNSDPEQHGVALKSDPEQHGVSLKSDPEQYEAALNSDPEQHGVALNSDPEQHEAALNSDSEQHGAALNYDPEQQGLALKSDPEQHEKALNSDPEQHGVTLNSDPEQPEASNTGQRLSLLTPLRALKCGKGWRRSLCHPMPEPHRLRHALLDDEQQGSAGGRVRRSTQLWSRPRPARRLSELPVSRTAQSPGVRWLRSGLEIGSSRRPSQRRSSVYISAAAGDGESRRLPQRRSSVYISAAAEGGDSRRLSHRRSSVYISAAAGGGDVSLNCDDPERRVLELCGQQEPTPFQQFFRRNRITKKIGEGVYGEVFLCETKRPPSRSVIKIMPIEGDFEVNEATQKSYGEVLSELLISKSLSGLNAGAGSATDGFVRLLAAHVLRGGYPARLRQLWQLFDQQKGSENEHPGVFPTDQLFLALHYEHAGTDLENFQFEDVPQAVCAFWQVAFSLAVGETLLEFEHRDLHWGNVLLRAEPTDQLPCQLLGRRYQLPTAGVRATLIDFTLSRLALDGAVVYNNLAEDPTLFTATGDLQFDVYRQMRDATGDQWRRHCPATNVQWLHYIADKLCSGCQYAAAGLREHRLQLRQLQQLRRDVQRCSSASQLVEDGCRQWRC